MLLKTKSLSVALIFTLILSTILPLANVKAATDPVANFTDPNLNSAIHSWLGIPETEPIYKSDIQNKINSGAWGLSLSYKNIADLSGMEIFEGTGIFSINLNSNNITDLTPLGGIVELESLSLSYNNISDISTLNNLVNLKSFSASDNQISDIATISNFTNLTTLWLNSNNISNISSLQNLNNLDYLVLKNNEITDITPLKNLSNLTRLQLDSNPIEDLSSLKNLTKLMELTIGFSDVLQDVSVVSNFPELESLDIQQSLVKDISPVNGLEKLRWLNIDTTLITDLTTLTNLPSLEIFDISSNHINPFEGPNKDALDVLPGVKNIDNMKKFGYYDTTWVTSIDLDAGESTPWFFRNYETNDGINFNSSTSSSQTLMEYYRENTIFVSDDSGIAAVDAQGHITGVGPGSTTIKGYAYGIDSDYTTYQINVNVKGITLEKLEVTPSTATINVGETQQYIATATFSDGTSKEVTNESTWAIADENIADMENKGLTKGKNEGNTQVTATYNGLSDDAELIVKQPITAINLEVTPKTATILVGDGQAYQAIAHYSDGTSRDVTTESIWSISESNIAEMVDKGVFVGKQKGTTGVAATFEGLSDDAELIVKDPAPTLVSLEVAPKTATIYVQDSQEYKATAHYSDGTQKDVTNQSEWDSSLRAIAYIDNSGVAVGLSEGISRITATFEGMTDDAELIVKDHPPVITLEKLEVTPKTATIKVGEDQQYIATAYYSDGSSKNVTNESSWEVSSDGIAEINQNGLSKGLKKGTTPVTAKYNGLSDSATLNVDEDFTPPPVSLVGLEVTPKTATIYIGESQAYEATAIYSDGSKEDVTSRSIWTTSKEIALINQNGLAEGIREGNTPVVAEFQGLTDTAELIVKKPERKLIDLKVTPKTAEIYVDETQQYIATAYYDDGSSEDVTNRSIWNINNEDLANISDQGLAKGIKKGETSVIAEFQGLKDDAELIIKEKEVPSQPEVPEEPKQPQVPSTPSEPPSNPPNIQVPGVPKTGDGSSENSGNGLLIIVIATLLTSIVYYRRTIKNKEH